MLTRKIRITPTPEQEQVLWDLSEKCRLLYNFALAERNQNWEANLEHPKEERTYITYLKQQNALPSIKKQYPEYVWVYSKVLQMTLRRLDADFKSFFTRWNQGDKQARPPRFKGRHFFTTLYYNQSGFVLNREQKIIRFSHNHPADVELQFDLPWLPPITGTIKQVDIFQDTRHRWFVAIIIDEVTPGYIDNNLYQAIDLGITNLVTAVNMHGKFIQIRNRRADLYWKSKIREVQSKRDHCKKHSHKWHFYNAKLLKIHRKCSNQMFDFQHKISKKVVENTRATTLIIGDLDIKDMIQKRKTTGYPRHNQANRTLNHSLQSTGSLGRFAEFLTYKAERVGKRVTRIDESQTTRTCCLCGTVRNRSLSERDIHCDCGTTLDRDQNAAINIMLRFLSQKPPVNGEPIQVFLDGLHRHTALPRFPGEVDSMGTPV